MKTSPLLNSTVYEHTRQKRCMCLCYRLKVKMKARCLFFQSRPASLSQCCLVVSILTQAYLAPPAIGGYCVHDGLQAEGMIPFITHVTHQHLAVVPWVSTDQTIKIKKNRYTRLKIQHREYLRYRVWGFCKIPTETFWPIYTVSVRRICMSGREAKVPLVKMKICNVYCTACGERMDQVSFTVGRQSSTTARQKSKWHKNSLLFGTD